MHKPGTIEALAELIASTTKGVRPAKRTLRLIAPAKPTRFDSITRESVLQRIRFLRRAFRLDWLVQQAAFNRGGVDCLEDQELASLLRDMERARECIQEGVALEDAGLVRDVSPLIPED